MFDWFLASLLFGRPVPQSTAASAYAKETRPDSGVSGQCVEFGDDVGGFGRADPPEYL
jgi:hypothetical protein